MLAGYLTAQKSDHSDEAKASRKIANGAEIVLAKVTSNAVPKANNILYHTTVEHIYYNDSWHSSNLRCLLYVNGKNASLYKYGQILLIRHPLQQVKSTGNINLFDYKKFLARRNIYYIQYAHADEIKLLGSGEKTLLSYIFQLKEQLNFILNKYIDNSDAKAMLQGLLLGNKTEIDPEIIREYNAVGASHVLAISGLHVGILFLIFSRLFGFLKKRNWSKHIFFLILLAVIWTYAGITGFSASVSRASIMFSCITISQWISRKANIYNTLAIAAFILLLFDPNNLYNVGFQLSFIAVAGIVYFYPKFYRLLYFPHLIADYLWKLTCVSLSAQLSTLPLVIYYFHQIPLLGVISNFIVINGVWIILVFGFALFFCSLWSFMASLLGKFLILVVSLMNTAIEYVNKIPIGPVTHIYLKPSWTFLIILALLSFILFFEFRKIGLLIISTLCFGALAVLLSSYYWQRGHQQLLVFYQVPQSVAVEKIIGHKIVNACNLPAHNSKPYKFDIDPAHLIYNIDDRSLQPESQQKSDYKLLMFHKQRVLILNKPLFKRHSGRSIFVDYLVITQNASNILSHVSGNLKFRHLVVNSAVNLDLTGEKYDVLNLHQLGNLLLSE